MRYISLDKITDDMVLAQNIKDEFGRVLLTKGSQLSVHKRVKLKNFEINGVYIDDSWSADIFIEPTVDETLANRSIKALKEMNLDEVEHCASDIIDKLMAADDYTHDMEAIKAYDENTLEHSLNVAICAVELGIGMGYNFYRLKNLAIGSMLHDIGKRLVPIEIINKKGRLTDEEMEIVRKHPEYGYSILAKEINVFSSTREIVHQHHENWDGSGYPRGLQDEQIYELAMVTHVCDVYDALISKRSYKEAFSYKTAIDIIQKGRNTMFRPDVLDAFFKYVPIYHKGSEVELSDGQKALVFKNNRGNMLKPVVKLWDNTKIDLRNSYLQIVS